MSKLRVDELETFTLSDMLLNGPAIKEAAFVDVGTLGTEVPTNDDRDGRNNTFTGTNSFTSPLTVADSTSAGHAVNQGQDVTWGGQHEFTSMPTSGNDAIVEEGSNANGNWVKFASGTMICQVSAVGSMDVNTATGNLFRASSTVTWTFPVAFVGTVPTVSVSMDGTASVRWTQAQGTTLTTSELNMFGATSSATTIAVSAQAIGRWK